MKNITRLCSRNYFIVFFKYLISCIVLILVVSLGYNSYLRIAYPVKYNDYVDSLSALYGVDPALVYAVIRTESKFTKTAVSHAGAIGLMQIMPETFDWINSKKNIEARDKSELFDPETNIDCGVNLLSILINRYDNYDVVLSAYNSGIGNVDKWLKDSSVSQDGKTFDRIPYKETENYVRRVKQSQDMYKKLYFKKF